jgi:hypothetical protein
VKELLKQMLFQDERTGKFSTSKFMLLLCFYLILGINVKALYLDREIKNDSMLTNLLIICGSLYFGRKFNIETKNMKVGGEKAPDEK